MAIVIQSASSSQRVERRASRIHWGQVRWRCTQRRRTLGTRCGLVDSAGRPGCWPGCGNTGKVWWWCRTLWTRRWSSARVQPGWRRCQRDSGPRIKCEWSSNCVECLWVKTRKWQEKKEILKIDKHTDDFFWVVLYAIPLKASRWRQVKIIADRFTSEVIFLMTLKLSSILTWFPRGTIYCKANPTLM